jgi:hypothetical protein
MRERYHAAYHWNHAFHRISGWRFDSFLEDKNYIQYSLAGYYGLLSPDAGSHRGSSASYVGASTKNLTEGTSLLGTDPHKLQSYENRLLDVRIQKRVMFSAAWNEIVDHFRQEDIISNTENDNLKFS